jgi:hypothetical protein
VLLFLNRRYMNHMKIIFVFHLMTKQRSRPGMTMSPRPSMEKWPMFWWEGKTSLPGNERRGAWRAIPFPMESFRATTLIGFSAGRVATRTITLALNTYCKRKVIRVPFKSSFWQKSQNNLSLSKILFSPTRSSGGQVTFKK